MTILRLKRVRRRKRKRVPLTSRTERLPDKQGTNVLTALRVLKV
jgi:hypothetical protein